MAYSLHDQMLDAALQVQIISLRARLNDIEQYQNKTEQMCMEWSNTSAQINALEEKLDMVRAKIG